MLLPSNMLMLKGDYDGEKTVDPAMVEWCEETLTPGWEFGWYVQNAFEMKIIGKDGAEDQDIKVSIRWFAVRFATDYDMVAFRLRWAEQTSIPG